MKLLDIFDEAHIPVIRLGLNPTEEAVLRGRCGGGVSPCVRRDRPGKRYLIRARELIRGSGLKTVTLGVANGETSKAVGQRRCISPHSPKNSVLSVIRVRETDVEKGEIIIL